jgi:dinuclear metal center YbgI/SA1388 family protein
MNALEELAPARLAEKWDNVGLLVGYPEQPVRAIVIALDVDSDVVEFALAHGANLIVAHHPVIFKGITTLRQDTPQGDLLCRLIQNQIAVIAAHTNLDAAQGGVNDALAAALGLKQATTLLHTHAERLYKLAVFVPEQQLEAVRTAMGDAGAGHIGVYSHCSFSVKGEGVFLPLSGATPFIGEEGRLERVAEYKLETCVTENVRQQVLDAMLSAHPYEEVAYDLYALENTGPAFGMGRIGILDQSMSLRQFTAMVKDRLDVSAIKAAGRPDALIRSVAVCGGSGAGFAARAKQAGADVFVTGDVKYHEAQQAIAQELAMVDAGHFATEYPVIAYLEKYLATYSEKQEWNVPIISSPSKDIFWSL